MIPYVGSPQRGEPTYETPYTKSQTPLNGPNNTRSIMANSPITDVIFDFCGVLLDWNTRACLEGRFPDEIVERICADDDPCGFFRYEDRMDTGEDFADIYPDVVREQGQELADIFKFYIGHYADRLRRSHAWPDRHSCGRTAGRGWHHRCRLQHRRRARSRWGGCGSRS